MHRFNNKRLALLDSAGATRKFLAHFRSSFFNSKKINAFAKLNMTMKMKEEQVFAGRKKMLIKINKVPSSCGGNDAHALYDQRMTVNYDTAVCSPGI